MVDRDNFRSNSPTRNPNVQRSTSFGGAKLHFKYTGNETKTRSNSRTNPSESSHLETSHPRLPRQSTFDHSRTTNTPPSAPFSPEIPRRSTFVSYNPEPRKNAEEPTYEPLSYISRYSQEVPISYGDASSARISHPIKDVTLATSSTLVPSPSPHISTQNRIEAPPPSLSPHTRIYGSSPYSAYSSYDPPKKTDPAVLSPRTQAPPPVSLQPTATSQSYYPKASPSPIRRPHSPPRRVPSPHQRVPSPIKRISSPPRRDLSPIRRVPSPSRRVPSPIRRVPSPPRRDPSPLRRAPSPSRRVQPTSYLPDARSRRQTTTFLAPVVQQATYTPEPSFGLRQSRYIPAAPDPPPPVVPAPKPQSLNTQMQNTRLASPRRNNLTIGYSANQFQEIEKAKEEFKALRRKEEEAIRAKLEAKKKAEEEARLAERRRIEEAAKLEARRRVEETARLDAERLALEAMMRAAQPVDEDEDVAKFIQNLEQRIKDSRDSKNSMGALVGRQLNQNLAKSAENLTNAPNEVAEVVEGRDTNDQNNMTTDENQNRRKYAENYYDPEDDDSELNSLNSFLSTVTEEDPDMLSVNNQPFTSDPQPNTLQPRVISYIHNMVDGILSSLNKTDFDNADTHKMPPLYEQDLYANDAAYNYRAISEAARKFFTPQSSPVEDTKNSFYNDSL
ncbi:hypothetical protein CAEBREN_12424 [Caenorhabditis brenneri]|uniref:Uncharacterized protein n=1 Tax=Caenorhabditis brenneri TaxID=135651 RepID=G0M6X7_CAEBE|nr:hypothetical protein CAEBREN_12424 [Caenorhabditis brenneri]